MSKDEEDDDFLALNEMFHLQKNIIEISIVFNIVKYVIQHNSTDAQFSIGLKTAKRHDVKSSLMSENINSATHSAHYDIIIVRQFAYKSIEMLRIVQLTSY